MNRYPNLVSGQGNSLASRGNGFLRRKMFPVAGTFTHAFDPNLPGNEKGRFRVKAVVIGAGAGGADSNGSPAAVPRGGAGGGYAEKEFWLTIGGLSLTLNVGAGGVGSATQPDTGRTGGTSSVVLDGNTIVQATGGSTSGVGGVGSGGDINTSGGPSATTSSSERLSGSSAGSFFGNGSPGTNGANKEAAKWRIPTFWDVQDILSSDSAELFKTIEGIGRGAASGDFPSPTLAYEATFGGGGRGGFSASSNGAPGLIILYW